MPRARASSRHWPRVSSIASVTTWLKSTGWNGRRPRVRLNSSMRRMVRAPSRAACSMTRSCRWTSESALWASRSWARPRIAASVLLKSLASPQALGLDGAVLGRLQPSHRGLQLAVEPVVLDRHGGLGRQRAREVLEAGRERSHVTLDLVAAGEVLHAVALTVDELEHADHASVGRLEWHDQHRFRPVPDLAVVGPVGGERDR